MSRIALFRFIFVTIAAGGLGACGGTDAPPPRPSQPVTIVTLAPQPTTLTRELPGRVAPSLVAEVRPQVTGLVEAVLFDEGGRVEAGQPLYQLDAATYRADVRSATAALDRAIAASHAADTAAARLQELSKIAAVSRQDLENALAQRDQARAEVGVARAALARAEVVLEHARIVAPIAGRIGKSTVTRGALVTANQDAPLAVVQQLDPAFVDVTQSSAEWLALRRELAAGSLTSARDVPVEVRLEDGTAYAQPGRLAFTDLSVDPATGSYLLRVAVPNPELFLLPGMYVRAVVGVGQRADALRVPQEGIGRNPRGEAVALVVEPDGRVAQRVVQVSRTLEGDWLVESGLAAGERVVVEGLQKVRPGDTVDPRERTPAPTAAATPADAG